MAVYRESPLPVGQYWIRIPATDNGAFAAWREFNRAKLFFRETTETSDYTFYRFDVLEPVVWLADQFGFPNVIEQGDPEPHAGSIDQAPAVETPTEILEGAGEYIEEKVGQVGAGMFVGFLVLGALVVLSRRV
jgi:hypothetical protein